MFPGIYRITCAKHVNNVIFDWSSLDICISGPSHNKWIGSFGPSPTSLPPVHFAHTHIHTHTQSLDCYICFLFFFLTLYVSDLPVHFQMFSLSQESRKDWTSGFIKINKYFFEEKKKLSLNPNSNHMILRGIFYWWKCFRSIPCIYD